jgi:hypothetical protein
MLMPDIYISLDIEADGPIPGPFSMLAFGLAVAGRFDGRSFERVDPEEWTYYRELAPISPSFDPQALEVAHLDRTRLESEGMPPEQAMNDVSKWIATVSGDHRPVIVGFPLLFDWMFFYWYLRKFTKDPPITFSSGLDMKSIYQQKAGVTFGAAGKTDLPSFLRSSRPHTHNALDDAIEQAELFVKLVEWQGR